MDYVERYLRPYEMGSMYPKIVADCNRIRNEYLIEHNEYGVKSGKTPPIYTFPKV